MSLSLHLKANLLACAIAVALCASAPAQEMDHTPAKCTGVVAPPAALSAWTSKSDVTSADAEAGLASAMLMPGKAATVTLHPTRSVKYVTQPEKPGGSVASGGMLHLMIADAGTYQVSISSGAWLDILQNGKPLMSTAHAPGPACTGIMKTVQFKLEPGTYVLQMSANADPMIQVLVSKVS